MRTSGNPWQGSVQAINKRLYFVALCLCPSLENPWSLFVLSHPSLWHRFLISHWKLSPSTSLGEAGTKERAFTCCEECLLELVEYISL